MSPPALSDALRQLLRELPASVGPERVDRLWLFSPRQIQERESGLLVLSLCPHDAARAGADRVVVTLRYEAARVRGRLRRTEDFAEQGRAPADRVPRVIAGVLARLGDAAEEPYVLEIGCSAERWSARMAELGVPPLDPPTGE